MADQYIKSDIIEKLNIIPIIGTLSNIVFIAMKALQAKQLMTFKGPLSNALKGHCYPSLLVTTIPLINTVLRILQLIDKVSKADKAQAMSPPKPYEAINKILLAAEQKRNARKALL